jgi:hypothetical protein
MQPVKIQRCRRPRCAQNSGGQGAKSRRRRDPGSGDVGITAAESDEVQAQHLAVVAGGEVRGLGLGN